MKSDLLSILVCPACRGALTLHDAAHAAGEIESGTLRCAACPRDYPIVRYVPRFVPPENYAGTFGFQWNRFPRTQFDSNTGLTITRDRFFASSGWPAPEMKGKWVLDVGCGAGRFAEISLSTGARVVAIDYSSAVDACRASLGSNPQLDVVQADVYALPFADEAFDYVYCFGVIQHTPDVHKTFLALPRPLKPGGRLAVDVYPKLWMNIFWPKYWLRPFTKRMPKERLFALVEKMVDRLLPLSRLVGRIPLLGRRLRWLIPIANYEGIYPLTPSQVREWSVLDTFDMLSPAHDHPQSAATLRAWLAETGLRETEVLRTGHLVARGRR